MATTLELKRRWTGLAGAPASLRTAEPAYNGVDDILYLGKGDDGSGNATSVVAIAGPGLLNLKANLNSPALTGIPTAPTAAGGTNTTQLATTAFVTAAVAGVAVPDGDKGDITVSGSGTVYTIDAGVVTNAKLANMATQTFKGRTTAGTGAPEDLTIAQAKTLLGLTGTNSGDQTITLSGDVSGSGTAGIVTTIGANKVTLGMMAQVATATFLGRSTAATGNVEAMTVANAKTLLAITNVDNTSDVNKPVSTAQQAAINLMIPLTQKGAANGVATLDSSSKIPTSQLPALAITDTFVVASQAAMLALTAEVGDVAIRTDTNETYILQATPASTLANWQKILSPTAAVSSVFGRTGAVVATTGDYTVAQVTGAAPIASPTFTGVPAGPTAAPGTNTTQLATTAFAVAADALSLKIASNLSDLNNVGTARTNLGLGTMATQNASAVAITGGTIDGVVLDGGTF